MRATRSGRRFILLASFLAGGLLACQLIVGVKDDDGALRPEAGAPEGGSDSGDAQTACFLLKPPGPPDVDSEGGDGDGSTSFYALRQIVIDPTGATKVLGYDLDGRCTGLAITGLPGTINQAPCVTLNAAAPVDGDGGVDNAMQSVFRAFGLATHPSPDRAANFFNDDIEAGARTLIVAVRNYNRAADDTSVSVGLIASEGLDTTSDGGPRWNGTDSWTHADTWLSGPTLPLTGYVHDHVLVTAPHDIVLSFGGFSFVLRRASIVARIDANTTDELVDGVIVGRAVANELITASAQIPVQNKRCAISGNPAAISTICGARDIGSTDDPDASATCDSISMAFGFSAVSAQVNAGEQRGPADAAVCDAGTCSP